MSSLFLHEPFLLNIEQFSTEQSRSTRNLQLFKRTRCCSVSQNVSFCNCFCIWLFNFNLYHTQQTLYNHRRYKQLQCGLLNRLNLVDILQMEIVYLKTNECVGKEVKRILKPTDSRYSFALSLSKGCHDRSPKTSSGDQHHHFSLAGDYIL